MPKSQNAILVSLLAMFSLSFSPLAVAQTTVSPTSVNFGDVVVGTTGALHTVAFKNTGASAVTITSISVTAGGPYALPTAPSAPCPSSGSLAKGASCNIGLTLSPTELGTQPADALTITSSSASTPQTVALSGTGVEPTVLSATTVAFGSVAINEASAARTVTLYNYQLTPLTISPLTVPAPLCHLRRDVRDEACGLLQLHHSDRADADGPGGGSRHFADGDDQRSEQPADGGFDGDRDSTGRALAHFAVVRSPVRGNDERGQGSHANQ